MNAGVNGTGAWLGPTVRLNVFEEEPYLLSPQGFEPGNAQSVVETHTDLGGIKVKEKTHLEDLGLNGRIIL
jgi:hypothetical protein